MSSLLKGTVFLISELFPPKINRELFSRFLEFLTLEEKYSLIFSFPIIFDSVKFKPIKVKKFKFHKEFSLLKIEKFSDADLIVADQLHSGYNFNDAQKCDILKSKVFWIQHLEIFGSEFFTPIFFQLLSSKTKSLKCQKTEFSPKFPFVGILKAAPNLEEVKLCHTNIEFGNSWPDEILRFSSKLKFLTLSLTEINFNIPSLAILAEETYITIQLHNLLNNQEETFEMVKNYLSEYFDPVPYDGFFRGLKITYENEEVFSTQKTWIFSLKNA